MLRLLRWLIWGDGHAHHWKIIRQGVKTYGPGGSHGKGFYYDLQCDHCGNVKTKDT